MTSKLNKNNKSKLVLVLLMVSILCLSLFAVACNNDSNDSNKNVPSFSYTQTDDGLISNQTFAYGTAETELKNFPKTSVTGWSRSKDSNVNIEQSSAKSGVINVSDAGYEELVNALYKDTYIREFVKRESGKTEEADVKAAIKELFLKDKDTRKHDGAEDDLIYMLNNYRTSTYLGIGTAQKITSSSEITLNKGEYGKITVWVKTENILATANGDFGANIRIINKFNGSEQAEFAVTNIVTDGAWKEYTIYVKADDYFNTSIKVALGLGYDLGGITQGTAYFDDVTFTHLTAEEFTETNTLVSNFVYNSDEKIIIDVENLTKVPVLDVSFKNYINVNANDFFDFANVDVETDATLSNTGKDGTPFSDSSIATPSYTDSLPYDGATVNKVELKNASATVKFTSDDFTVDNEGYAYLAFYIKNQLDKFGSQSITFDVVDKFGSDEKINASITSITEVDDEWQKVGIVVKNNFAEGNEREFAVNVVIGPADVVSAKYTYEYATGYALISNPIIAKGTTVAPEETATDDEEIKYDLYSLLSSTAKASVALYAGYSSDYTDSSDTETYALTTAPSDIGAILTNPASVKGYQGIVADHFYVNPDSTNAKIDTRKTGDANGIAGLINSKYLSAYAIDGLETALAFTETEDVKAIQPIMIYNKVEDSYGYIGESNTIAASAYAKVSVTLRVYGNAKAYVYLVDVNDDNKSVLTFTAPDQTDKQLALTITKDNMNDNGWVTVTFYVAAGATAKDFRVEMWNGSRDGVNKSQGFVFIKNVTVSTSSAFSETAGVNDIYTETNPIGVEVLKNGSDIKVAFPELLTYTRELSATEIKFNDEYRSDKDVEQVKYSENYVWAKNSTMIYAVYNTLDPVETDPYANIPEDDNTSEGCVAETDPSTFWLSFSSILLGVALVIAIIMLFIKNIRRRRKANASDAKSHFTVTSRTKIKKDAENMKKAAAKKEKAVEEVKEETEEVEELDETVEEEIVETDEEVVEEPATEVETDEEVKETEELTQEEKEKQVLDSYVYGEVQIFGEEKDENKD